MNSPRPQATPTATADPAEVARFDAIAHRFWDPEGEFMPLHRLNPVRAEFVASRAALQERRVVDVGCGGGLMAEALHRAGARVTAVDLAPAMIEVAKLHALEGGLAIDYRVASSTDLLATEAGSFDVVTCMEMIEHVPDPASVVRACSTLVKPGGWVFFSTINRNPKAFLFAIVGAEYVLRLLPRGTHEYAKFVRPAELAAHCRASGLALDHMRGMEYNPLTQRYWLSGDTSVNYLVATRKA